MLDLAFAGLGPGQPWRPGLASLQAGRRVCSAQAPFWDYIWLGPFLEAYLFREQLIGRRPGPWPWAWAQIRPGPRFDFRKLLLGPLRKNILQEFGFSGFQLV